MKMINKCLKKDQMFTLPILGYYITKISNFQKEIDFYIKQKHDPKMFYQNYFLYKLKQDLLI